MAMGPPRRVVLGLGNPGRGDDAAGTEVARRLRGTLPADVEVVEEGGEAGALLSRFGRVVAAYLVDACASGAAAGTIRRFDLQQTALPQGAFGLSTHGFGPAEAVELARALGKLPPCCVLYAIEGAAFEVGAPLSPPVSDAVAEAARRLRAEILGQADMER